LKILAVVLGALCFSPTLPAQNTFVRVNQVGYETGANSRAYLMSKKTESQATFNVLDANGKVAFSGVVGATSGAGR
jgi:cellulase-like Ig domain-containing protein